MGKPLTFLFLILGIWVYAELQFKGTQGAFGGVLAGVFEPLEPPRPADAPPPGPITDRVRDHLNGVMSQYEDDRRRMTREN